MKDVAEPVATIEYLLETPGDKCTWLGLLQIKKEYQGRGYGTRILGQIEEIFRGQQVKNYRIGVIAENEPALKFWKKHGFQEVKSVINEDAKETITFEKNLSEL
ncbi:hypothetical protein GCM10008967_09740 [Bacillus carboniphilus]|uniref:N-acetyltransferase domain-containing protein n=1 Tax=Bacillus carboniphilus TaxID=86663 RepID=A0ABN0VZK0_9BACI